MPSWNELFAFIPAALLVAISPGANNLLAMRNGLRWSSTDAIVALSGRVAAFTIMVALVVAGLASVVAGSRTAFEAIKWVGVGYLLYLGVRALRQNPEASAATDARPWAAGTGPPRRIALARQEFLVAAANPKALLLFTAFVPQFVDPAQPAAAQLLVLGALYVAIEFVAACGWATAGGRIASTGLSAAARRRLEESAGVVFIAMAAWLATAQK
jgi:threonine/homoserine/homoserine lactone efflux protein